MTAGIADARVAPIEDHVRPLNRVDRVDPTGTMVPTHSRP
jgi:hypothetical protein